MRNEAGRRFEELDREKPAVPTWQGKRFVDEHWEEVGHAPLRYYLRRFLFGYRNPIYSRLPRRFVYTILRNVLYTAFILREWVTNRREDHAAMDLVDVPQALDLSEVPIKGNIASSLRGIVRKLREKNPGAHEEKILRLLDAQ